MGTDLGGAATVGAVALLRAVAADLRLRACLTSSRMIFLREARAVGADLRLRVSLTSQRTCRGRRRLWSGGTDAPAVEDLRKLSGLCPLSLRTLFLRDVTARATFLRGATVGRVTFLRDATAVTGMLLRGATMMSFLLLRGSCCRQRLP